jgi:hypothetical protein
VTIRTLLAWFENDRNRTELDPLFVLVTTPHLTACSACPPPGRPFPTSGGSNDNSPHPLSSLQLARQRHLFIPWRIGMVVTPLPCIRPHGDKHFPPCIWLAAATPASSRGVKPSVPGNGDGSMEEVGGSTNKTVFYILVLQPHRSGSGNVGAGVGYGGGLSSSR